MKTIKYCRSNQQLIFNGAQDFMETNLKALNYCQLLCALPNVLDTCI